MSNSATCSFHGSLYCNNHTVGALIHQVLSLELLSAAAPLLRVASNSEFLCFTDEVMLQLCPFSMIDTEVSSAMVEIPFIMCS
jgi:hypothetical protein